jgi:flagellar FliL protein
MADGDKDDKHDKAGGGKKKLIIIAVVVLLAGGGAYVFLGSSKGSAAAAAASPSASPSYQPGPIVQLDPVTINLAGGHYLKLGMALQASKGVGADGEMSGAKAIDAAIELFSNRTLEELTPSKGRDHFKDELIKEITELYEGEVYDIYFTEFVMQ